MEEDNDAKEEAAETAAVEVGDLAENEDEEVLLLPNLLLPLKVVNCFASLSVRLMAAAKGDQKRKREEEAEPPF